MIRYYSGFFWHHVRTQSLAVSKGSQAGYNARCSDKNISRSLANWFGAVLFQCCFQWMSGWKQVLLCVEPALSRNRSYNFCRWCSLAGTYHMQLANCVPLRARGPAELNKIFQEHASQAFCQASSVLQCNIDDQPSTVCWDLNRCCRSGKS